jgi:leukotriene-A4 hydrolase
MQALRTVLPRRISFFSARKEPFGYVRPTFVLKSTGSSTFCDLHSSAPAIFRKMSTVSWTPPAPGAIPAPPLVPPHDIHSHANLLEIKPKHIDIQWTVDWEKRVLSGKVTHTIEVTKEGVDQFIVDTSHLDIKRVSLNKEELKWEVGKRRGTLGSPLTILLGNTKQGDVLKVDIEYSTTEQCTALGWLKAE